MTLKNSENIGMEEIGLVTPTPGLNLLHILLKAGLCGNMFKH